MASWPKFVYWYQQKRVKDNIVRYGLMEKAEKGKEYEIYATFNLSFGALYRCRINLINCYN